MPKPTFDPITLEVMRNGFYSIADEMVAALIRASYSTNIKDRRDTSGAIYTGAGEIVVVAQSEIGTPVHLGTMHSAVLTAMEQYPFEQLEPGDALALNTPYPAGPGHLNDLALISPVFHEGELIAIAANQAHHVDMGGFAPGSMPFGVTEIFQEGLQIPTVRLFRKGALVRDLWAIISQNVRPQKEVRGDLLAQYAANNVAERRLNGLASRYGVDVVRRYLGEMLDYSERRMRAALTQIPPGVYTFEDVVEGDGITEAPITIRVELRANGDSLVADFTATDDACQGPLNCRWPSVAACVYYVLKACLDPELPPNAGAYRPIDVRVRDGSLLSARYPMAVCNANIITTQRITDVLLGALAPVIPERVIAACSGTMNLLNIGGIDPRNGIYYNFVETYAGGQGAMFDSDGMDAVQNHMTNTRNAPVEAIELAYPLLVESYGLVPDSEGAGHHRGGLGIQRSLRVLGEGATLTLSSDRERIGPWGLFGGQDASSSACSVRPPQDGPQPSESADATRLPCKITTSVPKGRTIVTRTPGGGGWGDPTTRDPQKVARDVREGFITPERARSVYATAIDEHTGEVDEAATAWLRGGQAR